MEDRTEIGINWILWGFNCFQSPAGFSAVRTLWHFGLRLLGNKPCEIVNNTRTTEQLEYLKLDSFPLMQTSFSLMNGNLHVCPRWLKGHIKYRSLLLSVEFSCLRITYIFYLGFNYVSWLAFFSFNAVHTFITRHLHFSHD